MSQIATNKTTSIHIPLFISKGVHTTRRYIHLFLSFANITTNSSHTITTKELHNKDISIVTYYVPNLHRHHPWNIHWLYWKELWFQLGSTTTCWMHSNHEFICQLVFCAVCCICQGKSVDNSDSVARKVNKHFKQTLSRTYSSSNASKVNKTSASLEILWLWIEGYSPSLLAPRLSGPFASTTQYMLSLQRSD